MIENVASPLSTRCCRAETVFSPLQCFTYCVSNIAFGFSPTCRWRLWSCYVSCMAWGQRLISYKIQLLWRVNGPARADSLFLLGEVDRSAFLRRRFTCFLCPLLTFAWCLLPYSWRTKIITCGWRDYIGSRKRLALPSVSSDTETQTIMAKSGIVYHTTQIWSFVWDVHGCYSVIIAFRWTNIKPCDIRSPMYGSVAWEKKYKRSGFNCRAKWI